MKNLTSKLFILVLCALSFSSCSKESIDEEIGKDLVAVTPPVNYSPIELEIMERINDYRTKRGFSSLNYIDEISWVAEDHNFYMIEEGKVSHDDFASRYSKLVDAVGAKAVSENVAYGYNSAEAVVNAWINSEGHRENLEGNLTHFGISVTENAEGKLYFTNIFIRK